MEGTKFGYFLLGFSARPVVTFSNAVGTVLKVPISTIAFFDSFCHAFQHRLALFVGRSFFQPQLDVVCRIDRFADSFGSTAENTQAQTGFDASPERSGSSNAP